MHLPENEDVTIRMARAAGIVVPLHGLIWSKDHSLTYFINGLTGQATRIKFRWKIFFQIAGLTRDTRYNYSLENPGCDLLKTNSKSGLNNDKSRPDLLAYSFELSKTVYTQIIKYTGIYKNYV